MKRLICVWAVISLCLCAESVAACFQNAPRVATLSAADCGAPPAGCLAAYAPGVLGLRAAPFVNPYAAAFGAYGFHNLALRERFVNGRLVRPIVVLDEVDRRR